jgi:hypothetical protein
MKTLFSFVLICSSMIASAQIAGKKLYDPIKVFDSITVKPGDTLYLGSGTDRRGDFVYIYQPPNYWGGVGEQSLPRSYAGKYVIIKFFKRQADKRTGDKTIAVINPYGGLNYVVDIEGGVNAQEIVAVNHHSLVKKAEPTVVVQQQPQSTADELAKLKKLYDDGTLTKEEYEAAKKKLLEKN